jgi:hypothetical protein
VSRAASSSICATRAVTSGFLEQALRYRVRFIAYYLSIVEQYPSFEEMPAQLPQSGAA